MTLQERRFPQVEACHRARRIRAHLDRHGASLAEVVAVIDDVFITHALETAWMLAEEAPVEYVEQIAARLKDVLEALECVPFDKLCRHSDKFAGPDLGAAARWHGARLTDLLS
ncbi:hypothetical protein ORIO_04490 [Cereibacter azotoformans]|uniref:hypothetical protein n=1 Tax=Cereibacter azotoformans TaxID=43057 RepID=UPI001EEA696B|nr:hypothetical protein [Cereibacter azotoformans]ULB09183.1 hypothetical protein ORIO_04490 [Cereibacter azotoformans]